MSYFTLVFLAILARSSTACNTFACSSVSTSVSNTCMSTSGNLVTLNINVCNSTSTCSSDSTGSGSCMLSPNLYNLFPGRKCSQGWYCQSGTCTNGVCVGVSLGGSCMDSSYCNPGLFCNLTTSLCQKLNAIGQACSTGSQCAYNAYCNLGVCTMIFSLPDGSKLSPENCATGTVGSGQQGSLQTMCQSGMCFIKSDGTAVCGTAVTYSGGDFVQCTSSSNCPVTYAGITNYMTCTCAWNAQGTSYCALTSGSSAGQAYIKFLKSIFNLTVVGNFNTLEDYTYIAKDSGLTSLYQQGAYTENNFNFGAQFHGAPSCVIQTTVIADYSAYSSYSSGEIIGSGIVLALVGW